MSKKNEYRFNLRFDENDEDHRKVCQFLNDYCGSRKKARYIVKAVLAYWTIENKSIEQIAQKPVFSDHFVSIDGEYEANDAEVSLMLKNYKLFDNSEE